MIQSLPELLAPLAAARGVRTWFVARDLTFAREAIRTLARRTGGVLGWEPVTLRSMASELAAAALAEAGEREADDVELVECSGRALAAIADGANFPEVLRPQVTRLGFRTAMHDALQEARVAGRSDQHLADAPPGAVVSALRLALPAYATELRRAKLADTARVFALALAACERGDMAMLPPRIVLEPGLSARGLRGRLLQQLLVRGAVVLPAQYDTSGSAGALFARSGVTLEFYRAATPGDEVREALRRAIAAGARWDDIEIATSDRDTYGIALDAIAAELHIPVTMLDGMPLSRSRIGRALDRWLEWMRTGLPAGSVYDALQASEIALADMPLGNGTLARDWRALGIGWGRARMADALARVADGRWASEQLTRSSRDEAATDGADARAASIALRATALQRCLTTVLDSLPPAVPTIGDLAPVAVSLPALAQSALAWFAMVQATVMPESGDAFVLHRLTDRLARLRETDPTAMPFDQALVLLRQQVADLRTWREARTATRTATGGAVHLTSLEHAGVTGRSHVFLVGLDADRLSGARAPDPVLTDAVRHAMNDGETVLPLSADRSADRRRQVGEAFTRPLGRVTLSYTTFAEGGEREVSPSDWMLAAMRVHYQQADMSYDDLRAHLGDPCGAVARTTSARLDARDVWLAAVAVDPAPARAVAAVTSAFPPLAQGVTSHAMVAGDLDTTPEALGIVRAAAGHVGPLHGGAPASASSLETLGRCPLAYFYRVVLKLRPPEDVEFERGVWLDAANAGSLLHDVFEQFGQRVKGGTPPLSSPEAHDVLRTVFDAAVANLRSQIPAPSDAAAQGDMDRLWVLALSFLQFEQRAAQQNPNDAWQEFEFAFGVGAHRTTIPLHDRRQLPVLGFVDRIDRRSDGTLRIVDYKTGRARGVWDDAKRGAFDGGRKLQPVMYAMAVAQEMRTPVSAFAYRFPKEVATKMEKVYDQDDLANGAPLLDSLIAHLDAGTFVPTNDASDCKYCDYQSVCRAMPDQHGSVASPRAEFGKRETANAAYAPMRQRRGDIEEAGDDE